MFEGRKLKKQTTQFHMEIEQRAMQMASPYGELLANATGFAKSAVDYEFTEGILKPVLGKAKSEAIKMAIGLYAFGILWLALNDDRKKNVKALKHQWPKFDTLELFSVVEKAFPGLGPHGDVIYGVLGGDFFPLFIKELTEILETDYVKDVRLALQGASLLTRLSQAMAQVVHALRR